MQSPLLDFALPVVLLYATWAVVLSDSRFHRVWSLALSLLLFLTTRLFNQPFSASSLPLAMLLLLVFIVCILLSPAQLLLFHTKPISAKRKALKIFNPENEVDHSVDIVAVHGLAANPETTWLSRLPSNNITADNYQAMWLRDFLPTEQGLNARIMAFNHNTSWDAYALDKSLHDHGHDLLQALRTVRHDEARHRPIIFIGHSFGGLIINQALVNAGADSVDDFCRSIRQKACGFIFLGTPHKGARIALLGQIWSLLGFWRGSNTSLLEVTNSESATNQNLHHDFMNYLQSDGPKTKNTVCVFEAVKQKVWRMPIIHVVDKDSAIIDGSHKIGFETDHRNMQRFPSREDEDYKNILDWISGWVKQAKQEAHKHHIAKAREKTRVEQECLKSLYFPNMDQREYLVAGAATNTCTWLLNHEKYTTWLTQPHALLWIVGKPGAGKSTLLRYALQEASHSNEVVASFFFFGRGSDLQKGSCGLFRSLLHQLLDKSPEMLSDFISIYDKKRETKQKFGSDCEWHETELREFLERWILGTSRDFPIQIYVDALDEGGQDVAVKLVTYFEELIERLSPTGAGFKICFSCRHYPVLAPEKALIICVEEENDQDIATYVRQRLTKHHFSDPAEAHKLEQEIIGKASRVFQWVVLIIPIIIESEKNGASVRKLRQKIKDIPGELGDLYEHILSKIEDQNRALQLMQWVCFAQRPLSLEELRYAMVVDVTNDFASLEECESSVDFAETDEQMKRTVNSLSGGLAETVEYKGWQTVRFIHQSVNDYLILRGLRNLDSSFFHDVNRYLDQSGLPSFDTSFSDNVVGVAHFRISRSCVKYMTLEEVLEKTMRKRRLTDRRFAFLRYTASWPSHAGIVEKLRIPQGDLLHLFRWRSDDIIKRWAKIFELKSHAFLKVHRETLLGLASQHGFSSVIEAMIESGVSFDSNQLDWDKRTPLSWAAGKGHEAVVRLLIERDDVDLDSVDRSGQTPLSRAAHGGHEAVVRLLIKRDDVDLNSVDRWGQTSLSYAAYRGHEAVVRLLIARDDVDLNPVDRWGQTPLSCTAQRGHEAVVRLLIARDNIDIDSKDNEGRTPLDWAIAKEHKAVVELLEGEISRRHQRLQGTP